MNDIINTRVVGEPYVAGIITNILEDTVSVIFPYSKSGINEFSFKYNEIIPFKTQFPLGKFEPIYLSSQSRDTQRRMIKRHEDRAKQYLDVKNNK